MSIETAPPPRAEQAPPLLDLDLGADFLELLLDRRGLVLGDPFLDWLGRALDEVLGFLQAERGDLADDLDDVDLVGADFGQRDGEFSLLFGRGRGGAAAAAHRHAHRHRGRGGDAKLGLERLDELRQLEDGNALDVFDHLLLRHFGHCSLLKSSQLSAISARLTASSYDSDFFFSYATRTFIRSRGAAFSTLTICTIGACSTNSSLASSSGLPGSAASSVTSAGCAARPCTSAALIFSVGAVLANVVSALASATGSVSV